MGNGEKDSREFSRFKIPWIRKWDKTRCKTLRGSALRPYVHLGSVLTLQNPGPHPKDSDTEGQGRGPGPCLLSALQGDSAAGSPLTDLAVVGSSAPEA